MKGKIPGLLAVLFASLSGVFAQTTTTQNLVYVSVSVTSSTGTPMSGLAWGQFRLLENNIEQPIYSLQENSQTNEYRIGYAPTNTRKDGLWRRIRVVLVDPSRALGAATVRHTSGYYAQ